MIPWLGICKGLKQAYQALNKVAITIEPIFLPDAAALVPISVEDELDGMALVCFPGSQCTQYPAAIVYDALAKEIEGIAKEVKRSGAGYLFRL